MAAKEAKAKKRSTQKSVSRPAARSTRTASSGRTQRKNTKKTTPAKKARTAKAPSREHVEKIPIKHKKQKGRRQRSRTKMERPRLPVPAGFFSFSLVKYEQPMIQIARGVGTAFVVIGAIFSLVALDRIAAVPYPHGQQLGAATLDADDSTTIDETPDVIFDVPLDTPVDGILDITMTVDYAEHVDVMLFYADAKQHYELGSATLTAEDTWVKRWDTTQFQDGEYRVIAVVTNQFGTYEDKADSYVLVDNLSDTDSTTDATTETTEETPDVVFDVPFDTPISGTFDIPMSVPDAESIDVMLFHKEEQVRYELGAAEVATGDTWIKRWDTTQFQDGEYRIIAVVTNQYGTYDDMTSSYVLVGNHTDSTSETTTEQIFEVVSSEEQPFDGDVDVTVYVDNARSVKFTAVPEGSTDALTLGFATQHDTVEWRFRWQTEEYPDGNYYVSIHVQTDTETYVADSKWATIDNAGTETSSSTDDTSDEGTLEETTRDVPEASLRVIAETPLSGTVPVLIDVLDADFVELYARRTGSYTDHFLGLARNTDTGAWRFDWDTHDVPNGEYAVFARVKNEYGLFSSSKESVRVYNEVLDETVPPRTTESVRSIEEEISQLEHEADIDEEQIGDETVPDEVEATAQELLQEYRHEIEEELKRLSSALRSGDETAIGRAKDRLDELRARILRSALEEHASDVLTAQIEERIAAALEHLAEDTERTERIIRERVGEEIAKDTDGDGITDYDEVAIYGTDPSGADTDGDGFNDGAEILGGYDPTNSEPEVAIRYESPKETGVVREDVVEVTGITAITPEETDTFTDGVEPQAVITGRGLPNSFVTLYVFSTPIVVTTKTADDGSWSYTFDKELPDGEHEVYVGVTDNAGRIIAKSEPLRFIKEAQAFTPVDAAAGASQAPVPQPAAEPTFLNEQMVLLVLSLSVVATGLVLLLLGLHLRERPITGETDLHA